MKVRFGLQTITWGDPQDQMMPRILDTAAEAGYAGVEIGWRRIAPIGPANLKAMLDARGLQLVASHAGGNLVDTKQADHERHQVDDILDGVSALEAPFLIYSGLKYTGERRLAQEVEMLNATARRCMQRGIRLLYHNHDFEFLHDARVFRALTGDTVPELGFCPDVGWIHKAGQECTKTLDAIRDRIFALHFKEFATTRSEVHDFCCLGDGCVPLREVAQWSRDLPRKPLWVIAEQDEHDGPPEDAARRNAEFLRSCFA